MTSISAYTLVTSALEDAMRERVYGGWVLNGRMKLEDSQRHIRRMRAVLATLEKLRADQRAEQPEMF
jgi:hypothetical protein